MTLEEYQAAMDKLNAQRKELLKEFKVEGSALMAEGFKRVFEEHPRLEGVRWKQYIPNFNDGEPCVFRVCDPTLLVTGLTEDMRYADKHGYRDSAYGYDTETAAVFNAAYDAVCAVLVDEDLLEALFGSDGRITITRDGNLVNEYFDHD